MRYIPTTTPIREPGSRAIQAASNINSLANAIRYPAKSILSTRQRA